jgi:hypothetical protein
VIFIGFLDRVLDVLGLFFLLKGVWLLRGGAGWKRSFF